MANSPITDAPDDIDDGLSGSFQFRFRRKRRFRRLPTPSYPIQKMNRIGRQLTVWAHPRRTVHGLSGAGRQNRSIQAVRGLFSRDVTSREPKKAAQKWQIGATTSVRRSWYVLQKACRGFEDRWAFRNNEWVLLTTLKNMRDYAVHCHCSLHCQCHCRSPAAAWSESRIVIINYRFRCQSERARRK